MSAGRTADFQRSLGELPSHVTFTQRLTPRTTLALCFIRSLPDLDATIDILIAKLPKTASAWIIRPKTHLKPGFNENHVRDAALAHGLVDYKICAVDDNWSGIKFAWRKACGAKGAAQHATAACRPGCIARLQRSDDASCSLPARKAAGTKE